MSRNCLFLLTEPLYLCANVPVFSWFAGSSLSKSEHTVIDLGHGGAPRLVSFYFLDCSLSNELLEFQSDHGSRSLLESDPAIRC
jgi:hypothetical protein